MTTTTISLNRTLPFGSMLQVFRQMAGLDQTEMGQRLGVARPTISAWERGLREPSFSQVVAWAQITEQPIESLVSAVNATTAPAEAEAVDGVVRPKGLEPLTFWSVVAPNFWTAERSESWASLACQLDFDTVPRAGAES